MNKRNCFQVLIMLLVLSTAACSADESPVNPVNSRAGSTVTVTAAKTDDSDDTPSTLSPGPAKPIVPIAETAAPAQDLAATSPAQSVPEAPAGLVVAVGSMEKGWGLKVVLEDGKLQTLVEQVAPAHYWPDFDLSPDGQQLLYSADGEIWLLDIASGQTANVTHTPQRVEQVPRWLPGGDGFVCGSLPEDPEMEGVFIGYLTLVSFDGQYEVVVDEGTLAAPAAPAPDGERIAYSRVHERQILPFIFRIGSGEMPVDLGDDGLTWIEKSWEASWSPDGQQLAWSVAGEREGAWRAAEVLLNPAARTHTLLHDYRPLAMGGSIPAPRWAPDGGWLAFVAGDEQPSGQGIWKINLESGIKEQLSAWCVQYGRVRHPAISLDGNWIAGPPCAGGVVTLINVNTSTAAKWKAPAEVAAVGWAAPAAVAQSLAGSSTKPQGAGSTPRAPGEMATAEKTRVAENTPEVESELPYRNDSFRFQLTLPLTWDGFQYTERLHPADHAPDAGTVCFTFTGHPPFCILKIDVWTKSGWDQQDWIPEGYYLGENEQYIFAAGPHQDGCVQLDEFQCARHQEVPKILEGFRVEE